MLPLALGGRISGPGTRGVLSYHDRTRIGAPHRWVWPLLGVASRSAGVLGSAMREGQERRHEPEHPRSRRNVPAATIVTG